MLAGPLRRFAGWSCTPRALAIGTAITVLAAVAAVSSLVLIGFAGFGTHLVPAFYQSSAGDSANGTSNTGPLGPSLPNEGGAIFNPPAPGVDGPLSPGAALNDLLGVAVLQSADLPQGFTRLDSGPTGGDASRDLTASYHAVYQLPAPAVSADGTVAVVSLVGLYGSPASASFHLHDLDIHQLGTEAGLPASVAEPVDAATVGDDSRVAHLTTVMAGVEVGVYVVQFRQGAVEGVVAIAAPQGRESLYAALAYAQLQDDRIHSLTAPQG